DLARSVRPLVLRGDVAPAGATRDARVVALAPPAPARFPGARAAPATEAVRNGRGARAWTAPRRVHVDRSARQRPRSAQRDRLLHLLPRAREGQLLEGIRREGQRSLQEERARDPPDRVSSRRA